MTTTTTDERVKRDDSSPMGSPSNSTLSHTSRTRRQLNLMDRLHATGVQVDIDLPMIAATGSQSSGKSSLMEAISGVSFPRSSGTCTRCPIECRLSRADGLWQCIVSLRFTTDAMGQPLGSVRNAKFGETIYDKIEVEERIRRAQRAILNPDLSFELFLDGKEGNADQLTFSKNCVNLQISGPDLPDLSFCDLPGLIASSTRGNNDIALIEDLVQSYIRKKSCVILLAVSCETDFENQGAYRLAKAHDPKGKRTIGVLTKPDRIPKGEEQYWLSFIRNEKEPLEHNWYCVKQPSSEQLNSRITWEEARKFENEYFSSTAPWSELESIHQKYIRTGSLVQKLSTILADLIMKRMPYIQSELDRSINDTRTLLSQLPPAPSSDPHSEILALLQNFSIDLGKNIQGLATKSAFGSNARGLIQAIRPSHDRFRKAIRATAPEFHPFNRKDRRSTRLHGVPFLAAEEGSAEDELEANEEEVEEEDSIDKKDTEEGLQTPPAKRTLEPTSNGPFSSLAFESKIKICSKDKLQKPRRKIYIDEVLKQAQLARTRELPGHYPFVVQQSYIQDVIKEWRDPAIGLCQDIHDTLFDHVETLVKKHFFDFGQHQLEQRLTVILRQHINKCADLAEERVQWLLKLEDLPFTLNTHYLQDYKTKFLSHYKTARQENMQSHLFRAIEDYHESPSSSAPISKAKSSFTSTAQPTGVAKVLAGLSEIGLNGITPRDLSRLLPPDPMEPALVIMADVRAYFQVAYKRFADNVPIAIDVELIRGLENNLLPLIYSNLGINGPDGTKVCQELSLENPQIADKRDNLTKKLARLEAAYQELLSLGV